jgi:hypothetical protein
VEVIRKNNQWQYASQGDHPGNFLLCDGTLVRCCKPSEANEALGIMARPDDLMDSQYIYLGDLINNWCDAVRSKHVHRDEAWYCLNHTIMKMIEYCLVATTLSRDQVDALMRPIFKLALNLCGLQKNLPRTLLYGSPAVRGLGMKDPYWLQLVVHLTCMMKHQHFDTPSKDLHRKNMELVQTYVGMDQNFWDLPFEMFGYVAPTG